MLDLFAGGGFTPDPFLDYSGGPGIEKRDIKEHTVLRLGTGYEFGVGPVTISPQLHYDYLPEYDDAVVAAVGIGFSF